METNVNLLMESMNWFKKQLPTNFSKLRDANNFSKIVFALMATDATFCMISVKSKRSLIKTIILSVYLILSLNYLKQNSALIFFKDLLLLLQIFLLDFPLLFIQFSMTHFIQTHQRETLI